MRVSGNTTVSRLTRLAWGADRRNQSERLKERCLVRTMGCEYEAAQVAHARACEWPDSKRAYLPLPSVMVTMRSMPGAVTCSTLPSGQWISMSSIFVA